MSSLEADSCWFLSLFSLRGQCQQSLPAGELSFGKELGAALKSFVLRHIKRRLLTAELGLGTWWGQKQTQASSAVGLFAFLGTVLMPGLLVCTGLHWC